MTAETTITFLGTASVVPGCGHDTASFVINGKYLVDTGWYAAIKMRCYGLDPMRLEYLFLTHCHHDHYIGLPHLLFYLQMQRYTHPDRPPLKILGPAADLERVVTLARQLLQPERFPDVDSHPELFPLAPGDSFEEAAFRLETCASLHPVPGLCYRFTDKQTGAVFAFTGDTAYYPPIVTHVRGVSLLIHEASYGANPAPTDNRSLHSGAPEAARVALEAGVERLALVHAHEDRQQEALATARALFPNTFWPEDGQEVTVPGAKETSA
jgi:ribonuclease Z